MDKVKVRILVAVDSRGMWAAAGWRVLNDDEEKIMKDLAIEGLGEPIDPTSMFWLEAELPIPTINSVEANVVKVQDE